ncbi:MAG: hypothetical protein LUF02_06800 [Erysipelotrichaceae bacterium]|nr:hypothetical protein [Erysipelotrichaceae bacterium]
MLTPVVTFLNTVISKMISLANIVAQVFSKLFGLSTSSASASTSSALSSVADSADSASSSLSDTSDAVSDTADATTAAAKEIEGALAGFDDLNILSSSSSSDSDSGSSSGSSGGTDTGGYAIDSIDWGTDDAESAEGTYSSVVDSIVSKFQTLKDWLDTNGPVIIAVLAGILAGFTAFEVLASWGTITTAAANFATEIAALWSLISDVGVLETFSALVLGVEAPFVAVSVAIGAVVAALVYLYETSESFRDLVNSAVSNTLGVLQNFYDSCLMPIVNLLKQLYENILQPLLTLIATVWVDAVEAVATVILSFYNNVIVPLANFLVDVFGAAIQTVCNILGTWSERLKPVINLILQFWNDTLEPFIDWLVDTACSAFETFADVMEPVYDVLSDLWEVLLGVVEDVLTLDFGGLEETFSVLGGKILGWITGGAEGITVTISDAFSQAKSWFSTTWSNLTSGIGNISKKISGTFSQTKSTLTSKWKSITSGIGNISKVCVK